ncbi:MULTISPECIES: threonine ammonia-lyase [Streptomyces]|uniref:threonine ammonia-lyase n=2 Tax=Streptomyces TaxID=1883 RepID=L7F378_STRT8|nr:threonine/serine dehydratase [Streptomyces turgidiscabies]ELP65772.1 threonine dehydratase [Streptomyces turgidiscabies Car8]MDX3498274.1 threonine/serine dehydratase [Streptomyces turgidiscabies]GAQ74418.1 L-threonine dehydratase catabolic TdcB [Streptomyces turgidiscabies]
MTELTARDVQDAAANLEPVAARTPALSALSLDQAAGWPVVCKAESLQRTGSFKFRGAYHHASSLPAKERARGLVGASSGNHAQALALAGRLLEVPATVVIPADAPAPKVEGIRALGGRVVTYHRDSENRDALVAEIAARDGLAVVPSANSRHIMAGAGTAALELLTDHPEIETLVVPVGGGGLAAGTATIAKHLYPGIKVIGVEPEEGADTLLSMRCGQRIALPEVPATIADGLGHTSPSPMTWAVNSRLLDAVVTVTDLDITTAMAFAFRHLKVVAEPSGACALAAVLASHVPHESGMIGVVISGGGVDLPTFHRLISQATHRKEPLRV